jgi:uncharacterized protein
MRRSQAEGRTATPVDGAQAVSKSWCDLATSGAVARMRHFIPVALLVVSNVFMTFAWYGHLKYKDKPLLAVIVVCWGIALVEYCLAVPANRIGHGTYSAAELKTIQEVVTLLVFAVFSVAWLGESLRWNHAVGFVLLVAAAGFVFGFRPAPPG